MLLSPHHLFATCLTLAVCTLNIANAETPIRVGIIGCDTSHAPAFTKLVNGALAPEELAKIRVVAAYPGGSFDVAASRDRVRGFTEELRKLNVKIVDSVETLLPLVDAILLESVDGRKHLEQIRPVIAAGKPVFIDKPVAGSLSDAIEIFRLAEGSHVPCFSSSSLRFAENLTDLKKDLRLKRVLGCDAFSPCEIEPHHPDLFWYGVHGVEILFSLMGPGCVSVCRSSTPTTDVVVGVWKDGRVGTYRGIREGSQTYGATIYGKDDVIPIKIDQGYGPLLRKVASFFRTGEPPVSADETLEIFAFMEAADESKRRGGVPIKLDDVLKTAGAVGRQ